MFIAKDTARSLAVAYQAFADYHAQGENESMVYWGNRLLELQAETGIELYPVAWLGAVIESAECRAALAA